MLCSNDDIDKNESDIEKELVKRSPRTPKSDITFPI